MSLRKTASWYHGATLFCPYHGSGDIVDLPRELL